MKSETRSCVLELIHYISVSITPPLSPHSSITAVFVSSLCMPTTYQIVVD